MSPVVYFISTSTLSEGKMPFSISITLNNSAPVNFKLNLSSVNEITKISDAVSGLNLLSTDIFRPLYNLDLKTIFDIGCFHGDYTFELLKALLYFFQ